MWKWKNYHNAKKYETFQNYEKYRSGEGRLGKPPHYPIYPIPIPIFNHPYNTYPDPLPLLLSGPNFSLSPTLLNSMMK